MGLLLTPGKEKQLICSVPGDLVLTSGWYCGCPGLVMLLGVGGTMWNRSSLLEDCMMGPGIVFKVANADTKSLLWTRQLASNTQAGRA